MPVFRAGRRASMVGSEASRQESSGEVQPADEEAAGQASDGFPVVGIGASAGGLAAFEAFFCAMPAATDTDMAFVLVQHLAPDHKSLLTELVKRYTRMRVFEVEDGMVVKPNCAYIIPPNRDMEFVGGELKLLSRATGRGQRLPIDGFFRSLAAAQRERAICIVLSGTGSDGTLGVRAIKGAGGMAMAQNPESTEYDGMPRNAIATGLVDYVLPPAEMPAQLISYATHPASHARHSSAPAEQTNEQPRRAVLERLHAETGHDFSQYKQTTIDRRLERRLAVHHIENLEGYLRFLEEKPAELHALFQDLLIGVTNFFRDPDLFQALETDVLPGLIAKKPVDGVFRAWVPGCSTGEEAYSIAILILEALETRKQRCRVQVFATDIDVRAIEVGRAGLYSPSIASDITPERLSRYFSETEGGSFRVHKNVRDCVIFSEQDVAKDPPFSRLDLISCRNLMIYMGPDLQAKLIPLFHYALNPDGALFLGSSETTGEFVGLFTAVNRKAKVYQRKEGASGSARAELGNVLGFGTRSVARKSPAEGKVSLREVMERALLDDGRAAVLVNASGEVQYVHGQSGDYLQPAPGEMGTSVLKMVREGLRHELTSAFHLSIEKNQRVARPGLRVKSQGANMAVDLTVQPIPPNERVAGGMPLFLLLFEPVALVQETTPSVTATEERATGTPVDARVAGLESELRTKDESLNTMREQMQTANQELSSTNEELQSTNEELQSANEELETSKEELQSVNEELTTVNAELQSKVADLSRANNDMNNLLAGTGIGTLFVDQALLIRRFTPAVTQFINVIPTDVGRPLAHIVSNLVGYDGLVADVRAVLDTLAPGNVEVRTKSGIGYLLRIRPYRTAENAVEGAVITFSETAAPALAPAAADGASPGATTAPEAES
jgi:two-component system, chemotaxis family, CheB/CheR fusion protein